MERKKADDKLKRQKDKKMKWMKTIKRKIEYDWFFFFF